MSDIVSPPPVCFAEGIAFEVKADWLQLDIIHPSYLSNHQSYQAWHGGMEWIYLVKSGVHIFNIYQCGIYTHQTHPHRTVRALTTPAYMNAITLNLLTYGST